MRQRFLPLSAIFKGTPFYNRGNSPSSPKPCGKLGEKGKSVVLPFSNMFQKGIRAKGRKRRSYIILYIFLYYTIYYRDSFRFLLAASAGTGTGTTHPTSAGSGHSFTTYATPQARGRERERHTRRARGAVTPSPHTRRRRRRCPCGWTAPGPSPADGCRPSDGTPLMPA